MPILGFLRVVNELISNLGLCAHLVGPLFHYISEKSLHLVLFYLLLPLPFVINHRVQQAVLCTDVVMSEHHCRSQSATTCKYLLWFHELIQQPQQEEIDIDIHEI